MRSHPSSAHPSRVLVYHFCFWGGTHLKVVGPRYKVQRTTGKNVVLLRVDSTILIFCITGFSFTELQGRRNIKGMTVVGGFSCRTGERVVREGSGVVSNQREREGRGLGRDGRNGGPFLDPLPFRNFSKDGSGNKKPSRESLESYFTFPSHYLGVPNFLHLGST